MEHFTKTSHSPEIKELVSALAKAQGSMKPATYNRVNPHFKSRYADFASCMDACRGPLSENGLAVIQSCETIEGKLNLVTMLAHVSGQWMKSEFPLVSMKMDSQGIGSAMTYAKRYSLCGMVGIVADEEGDDDGEAAQGRGKQTEAKSQAAQPPAQPAVPKPKIGPGQLSKIKEMQAMLDRESLDKMNSWTYSAYRIDRMEDLLAENFTKVFGGFENAVKFMQQKQAIEIKETANV